MLQYEQLVACRLSFALDKCDLSRCPNAGGLRVRARGTCNAYTTSISFEVLTCPGIEMTHIFFLDMRVSMAQNIQYKLQKYN